MRILDFDVDQQRIAKSPTCDFGGLIAGTKGYLQARFKFSSHWLRYRKVAVFTYNGVELPVLITGGVCKVPDEVAACSSFRVHVVGKLGEDLLISSRVTIIQRRR